MIESRVPAERLQRVYDVTSRFYRATAALFDRKARRLGFDRCGVAAGERILEAGSGPGISLRMIADRIGPTGLAVGVDLSPRMIDLGRRAAARGHPRAAVFVEGDATRLPFPASAFDVLFSAYLLDLLPLRGIEAALAEFFRVLRPGGRLVLVGMTKRDESIRTWWERAYESLPPWGAAWILGGCRPLVLAGPVAQARFVNVRRELVRQFVPSEIVTAMKPAP